MLFEGRTRRESGLYTEGAYGFGTTCCKQATLAAKSNKVNTNNNKKSWIGIEIYSKHKPRSYLWKVNNVKRKKDKKSQRGQR